jgi:hypothetical protein
MPHSLQPKQPSRLSRLVRLALLALAAVGFGVLALLAWLLVPAIPDPAPDFLNRKGELVKVSETYRGRFEETTLIEMTLHSSSGLEVALALRVPLSASEPRPLVLLLGGHRTGRDAVRLFPDTKGAIIVAMSYPNADNINGEGLGLLLDLPEMRRALVDTTPAVLLALDYLLEQEYVDTRQVDLVGVSLGAFLVSIPGALDPRIGRVWLVHGGGEPASVLYHQLTDEFEWAPLRHVAAEFLAAVLCVHHLRPERWVGNISPRPVIIVNARDDEALPSGSIKALHAAAKDPVEIVWTEGQHVMPGRREIVDELTHMILSKVVSNESSRQE